MVEKYMFEAGDWLERMMIREVEDEGDYEITLD
jgi:hypothetical protein